MSNRPYLLALNRMYQVGPRTIKRLLARWPVLDELFTLSLSQLEKIGLPPPLASLIHGFDMAVIEQDLRWEQGKNRYLITWADTTYPTLLREIDDPPPVLYGIGDLGCFDNPTLAIVGTRKPSITGSETAWRFGYDLASNGVSVVSGLALGIDTQAHTGALAAKGKTIAVMGTGIDFIYPRRNWQLAEQIAEEGLLLTEFPLQTPPTAGHFPRRNRIISGLSLATLVVEAAVKSGSLITARLAVEQNRDVLAIPGSIHNPQARGCHYLVQQGATLVTSSQEVLDELGVDNKPLPITNNAPAIANTNTNLVKCIGFEVTTIDQIVVRSGLGIEQVTCDLADLELQGMVRTVSGGYMRCQL